MKIYLRSKGSISVVGQAGNSFTGKLKPSIASATADRSMLDSLRAQHASLQAQLDTADRKIEELRKFNGGNSSPSGGLDPHRHYATTPVPEQIKHLEGKKKQLQAQLDDLEEQARKNGIDPGELR